MAASATSYEFLEPPTQADDLGTLAHYRVVSELGRGGMGFVFRAQDIKLERVVALKVMNQKVAAIANSRQRFLSEARAMAAVHHDNVATIFEVNESNGTPFMAMEMLKGGTLETLNQSQIRLTFEKIIDYATQIARGLAAAHACGIVHRDIKPANIWIEADSDRIKILDFGLALASTPVDQLAGRGTVIGTPGYLSPEQARSDPLDDRSDLYSLGVVLYELCTGRLPIHSKSVSGQLISILAHRPQPINELNPEIPQPLCELVHRLIRKEPRSRPSSARQLAEDLCRVEVECHQTTEVAQAINRLKMGLTEVVSKKSSPSIFESFDEAPAEVLDPLAAIPADSMVMPTAASVRPTTRVANGSPMRNQQASAAPSWQTYWPVVAIIVGLLIALSVFAFLWFGSGDSATPGLVAQPGSSQTDSVPARNPGPAPVPSGAADNQASQKNKPVPATDQQKPTPQNSQNKPGNNQQNKSGNNQQNKSRNNQQNKAESSPPNNQQTKPPSTTVPVELPKPEAMSSQSPPPKPVVKTETVTISTADNRGADAMVQKGTTQEFGLEPNIGVRTRRGVETNHSYLRFDLASIEKKRDQIQSAELLLTAVGDSRPIGATMKVFGVVLPGAELWPEAMIFWNKSPSKLGLDKLPLLAETRVESKSDARDSANNVIRLASPELTKFVAEAKSDTVTVVISGEYNRRLLKFASREPASESAPGQSADQAPKLLLELTVK